MWSIHGLYCFLGWGCWLISHFYPHFSFGARARKKSKIPNHFQNSLKGSQMNVEMNCWSVPFTVSNVCSKFNILGNTDTRSWSQTSARKVSLLYSVWLNNVETWRGKWAGAPAYGITSVMFSINRISNKSQTEAKMNNELPCCFRSADSIICAVESHWALKLVKHPSAKHNTSVY